ncbi:MAG: T9SS type A sorting domain-containing protein, partial [Candidatus Cloacimonadaceae bacterium]|nr:T9SS type A sorting domain-containing protein [Candidatus Cloacimonadota bacterium]
LCNYPNPFNPSTTISYSVPTDGDVALSIYNARGQLVNTLVNEYKSKGRYLIAWQAKDLRGASVASGVYYLRLRSGNQSISRKILLTK